MFTGIIEEVGKVALVTPGKMTVTAGRVLQGMELGASMAVNGVCLTITKLTKESFTVDVMAETLARSNLGLLRAGDTVNLERPLSLGGQLGGHLVQGHVDDTGRIASMSPLVGSKLVKVEASQSLLKYVVEKGFIAVDGMSLTVADRDAGSFTVSIVNYTWDHTILRYRRVGDPVNLEADIIAKYVEQFTRAPSTGITTGFLQKYGYLV